jgi:hypothetical protein
MNPIAIVILVLTFAVIGYLLGSYFPLRSSKRDEQGEDADEQSAEPPPHKDMLALMRLWRHGDTKALHAEIEGELIEQGASLTPDQHGRLAMLLVDLQDWIGVEAQLEDAERASGSPAGEKRNREDEPEPTEENKKKRFRPLALFSQALQAEVRLPQELGQPSIAFQIDEILQEQIGNGPLAGKGVCLMEIEGRGLVVFVGRDSYDSVEEVPDEQIRAAIQSAVKEWERRALGGSAE